jgi:hypothetical protein
MLKHPNIQENTLNNWKIDVVSIDDLALFSEEEISDRLNKCKSEMGKRTGDWSWKERWETELAYAQRELQIRHERRMAHQAYLAREAEEERRILHEEDYLPEYDGNKIPRFVREVFEWS